MGGVVEMRMDPRAKKRLFRMNMVALGFSCFGLVFVGVSQTLLGLLGPDPTWTGHLVLGVSSLALAVVLGVLAAVLLRREADSARILHGDGRYESKYSWRTTRFVAQDAESVVTIDRMALGATPQTHHLIVVGPTKRLLMLVGHMWSTEQLGALANDLAAHGVPMTSLRETITPKQLRAMDRRLMPWWQAHPVGLGLLMVAGALALVAIGVAIALPIVLAD
jgi:hypothetical protein